MAAKQLTMSMSDIDRIIMLKMCSDPHTLASVMLASVGVDDENDTGECCHELLEFCKREGIDPMPAMNIVMQPSLLEMKIGGTMCGGSKIRTPFSFKEQ